MSQPITRPHRAAARHCSNASEGPGASVTPAAPNRSRYSANRSCWWARRTSGSSAGDHQVGDVVRPAAPHHQLPVQQSATSAGQQVGVAQAWVAVQQRGRRVAMPTLHLPEQFPQLWQRAFERGDEVLFERIAIDLVLDEFQADQVEHVEHPAAHRGGHPGPGRRRTDGCSRTVHAGWPGARGSSAPRPGSHRPASTGTTLSRAVRSSSSNPNLPVAGSKWLPNATGASMSSSSRSSA